MRRLGVRDSCRLRDVADHIHFHAAWRLAVVGRSVLVDDLRSWNRLEVRMLGTLSVRRAGQAQLKDVLRELNRAQKLRVVVDSGKDAL